MAPPVAAALAFVYVFNPSFGPVNHVLSGLGMKNPPTWFYSPGASKWALVFLGLWGIGDAMIIFLAGLLDVPRQLYEAADIEGATARKKFRFVTLPMITPVIFFSLVIGTINGFQYFTQAYIAAIAVGGERIDLGAPQNSLMFYSVYLYKQGFDYFRMGYASAHGLGPVPHHHGVHADHAQDVEALGALSGGDVPIASEATIVRRSAPTSISEIVPRPEPAATRRHRLLMAFVDHTLLISVAAVFLAPFVFVVMTSFMTGAQARTASLWPRPFQPSNYAEVFTTISLVRYTWNTLQIAVISTIGVLISSIPVAYALSRMRWRGRQTAFVLVLARSCCRSRSRSCRSTSSSCDWAGSITSRR